MPAYSFQKRFIEPILAGLGEPVQAYPKTQTIRAVGKRRHARPGEVVQLYTAMRTKQCRKLGEARCKAVADIRIFVERGVIQLPSGQIEGAAVEAFARRDGFASWADMQQFWRDEHGDIVKDRDTAFVGLLIQWERIAV